MPCGAIAPQDFPASEEGAGRVPCEAVASQDFLGSGDGAASVSRSVRPLRDFRASADRAGAVPRLGVTHEILTRPALAAARCVSPPWANHSPFISGKCALDELNRRRALRRVVDCHDIESDVRLPRHASALKVALRGADEPPPLLSGDRGCC